MLNLFVNKLDGNDTNNLKTLRFFVFFNCFNSVRYNLLNSRHFFSSAKYLSDFDPTR